MSIEPIRVLVVDDSALMRNLVSKIIEGAPDLAVAGTAMNGEFALQKIPRVKPDVLVLDLEMPKMNGIEFLRARREGKIDVPVIILSSIAREGAEVTMEALALGASDFILKPSGSVSHDIHVVGDQLVTMLRAYGGQYRRRHGKSLPEAPEDYALRDPEMAEGSATAGAQAPEAGRSKSPLGGQFASPKAAGQAPAAGQPGPAGPLEIIALGISTGGPNALRKVLAGIDGNLAVPILIVQHMPPGFTTEFAASLNRITSLEVREAADGDLVKPGRIFIAPGNYHMEIEKRSLAAVIRLHQDDPCNGHRPSAGVLFRSVAKSYGNRAMGVIMTGMGRDGAFEIGEIYRAGGMTVGQDEASSVVYGMPRVAWENGFVRRQVSLQEMAETINTLVKELV